MKLIQHSRTAIFWFRRDLRLDDNVGLFYALSRFETIIPLFILDRQILDLIDNKEDKRVSNIYMILQEMNTKLAEFGSSLLIKYGFVADVFEQIVTEFQPVAVYCNRDYEPETLRRDRMVELLLQRHGVSFETFKDQVIFESDEILKEDRKPYTVFTPYSKKWKQKLQVENYKPFHSEKCLAACIPHQFDNPDFGVTGFKLSLNNLPKPHIHKEIIRNYHNTRNFPANTQGTSSLSIQLRFGTVSIRKLVATALGENEIWLNELIWREFFKSILMHYPEVTTQSFRRQYDNIQWINAEPDFERWCSGTTGFALVDAGMRELQMSGLMHNRVRMLTASFLSKHLLIDWRWGEAWFASLLLDYDLSANNGNWQWTAGCGCDAAPYFRIFSPDEQIRKFDPDFAYIRRWIPEYGTSAYPEKMIDHSFARQRALAAYNKAIRGTI